MPQRPMFPAQTGASASGSAHHTSGPVPPSGAFSAPVQPARRRALPAAVAMCASVLALVATAATASAATFTVNSTADEALATESSTSCETAAHTCTLRAAVQAADNTKGANTISLPAGEYRLTIAAASEAGSEENPAKGDLDVLKEDTLTLSGAGSGSTTINANHIDRAFAVHEEARLSLSGVTIENGSQPSEEPSNHSIGAGYGGAIYNDGSLSVSASTLEDNQSNDEGGAIYSDGTSTSISGSTISHNEVAASSGGGVEIQSGSLSVSDSTFNYDSAPDSYSGALEFNSTGEGTITGSTFMHDSAYDSGAIGDFGSGSLSISTSYISDDAAQAYDGYSGGIYSTGALSVTSSTFAHDSGGYGGALYLESSEPTTLSGDTFASNAANYYYGGAIDDAAGGAVTATADTFTGNSADEGGALYYDGSAMLLTNDTFDGNSAYYGSIAISTSGLSLTNDTIANNGGVESGGIYEPSKASAIVNTIVADNKGGDCYSGPAGTTADKGYNIDSDGSCFATGGTGTTPESTGDQPGIDPLLALLADNGGPTETDALLPGSPAIGQALGASCPSTDQRGVARPAGSCDVGAYQAAAAALSLSKTAPASATAGTPVTYTLTVTDNGPGPSTGTTVTDQLPAGATLYGTTPSQGSCTSAGSPAKVTCDLGVVESGKRATVAIVVTLNSTGNVVNTATVTNGEGSSASASATTTVTPLVSGVAVGATTGAASLIGNRTATLAGSLSGVSGTTSYFFQYGTTKSYGQASAVQSTSAPGNVSAAISGLSAEITYHYRVVAINGGGVSYGADETFTTAGPPKLTIKVKRAKSHRGAKRFKVKGRLSAPAGFGVKSQCSGTVVVVAKHGKRRVARKRVTLKHNCTYSVTLKIRRRVHLRGKLKIGASFLGNSVFSPAVSRGVTARLG